MKLKLSGNDKFINQELQFKNGMTNSLKSLVLLSAISIFSCSEKIDYKTADEYILRSTQEWAEAINEGDSLVIDRIMAEDFVGISLRGDQYDKQTLIRESKINANRFYKPKVFNVKIRFYGNAAVAQGNETWTEVSDSSSTTNVWTDTWIYRDKKWKIVAAQDLKLKK
jgi:hypothetical protein